MPAEAPVRQSADTSPHQQLSSWIIVGVMAALVVAGLFALWKWGGGAATGLRDAPSRTVAVLPLRNVSGDATQDYFSDGLTEGLITELGQVHALRVISRGSAMTYKGANKSAQQVAAELHADLLVQGTILRHKDQVHAEMEMLDAKTGSRVWAQTYDRDMTGVLQMQTDMARAMAEQIGVEVTFPERVRLSRVHQVDPKALELYLDGVQRMRNSSPRDAIELFQRAIQIDPNYAAAHALLADAYGRMGEAGWMPYSEAFSRQTAEALRAIELDDGLPEPHLALAFAALNGSWNWATAQRELERALLLGPNSADVHWNYANFLERNGQTQRAVEEGVIASELDPASSRSFLYLSFHYYFDRQYAAALQAINHAAELNASPEQMLYPRAIIHVEQGDFKTGIMEFQRLGEAPHAIGHMGNAYAREGSTAEALAAIEKLKGFVDTSGIGRYEIALIYAGLKQNDSAFEWLNKAYQAHDKGLTYILIDPCIDPLRGDPRLRELEQRVGFPHLK